MPPRLPPLPLFLGSFLIALTACSESPPPDPRTEPPRVRTAIVQEATGSSRAYTGVVAARVQSDLGFRVSGKVTQRLVDAGQFVKRNQPLYRIDQVDLALAVRAQEEAVAAAAARAQQTAEDERRHRELRGTGAVSASAYDQAKAAADSAHAQWQAARAQAELARNATLYSELRADADGVVMETLAEAGQVVAIGQPVVRIARSGQREVIVQLPETVRPRLGSTAQAIRFGDDTTLAPATLRQLSEVADRSTRTFEARYVLGGALATSPLGATVTLRLMQGTSGTPTGFIVPLAAVFDAGKGPGVWLIQGDPAAVTWRSVTIDSVSDERARIFGDVRQGDPVVALGAHLLREGAAVRTGEDSSAQKTQGTQEPRL